MKRTGFIAAGAAVILILAGTAPAATRYRHSPRNTDKETLNRRTPRSGSVRTIPRNPTRNRSERPERRTTTPSVRNVNSGSTSVRSSTRRTIRPSRRHIEVTERISTSARHTPSPTTRTADFTRPHTISADRSETHRRTNSGRRRHSRDSRDDRTAGNVRRGRDEGNVHRGRDEGNVHRGRDERRSHRDRDECRSHRDRDEHNPHQSRNESTVRLHFEERQETSHYSIVSEPPRQCDRDRHDRRDRDRDDRRDHRHPCHWGSGPHCWASSFTLISRNDNAFIFIHSGPTGPYWHKNRWHRLPAGHRHGPGCGRVLYYGYWIDTRDYYYVKQIEPPWATREASFEDDDEGFILKGQVLDAVRVKELVLSTAERGRVETLIERGILQKILDEDDPYGEFGYIYDPWMSRLSLTAPAERIAVIETIICDAWTFEAFTERDPFGNTAAVVPLVSPFFLEQDACAAMRLALDNFSALRRMLEERDWRYAARGKTCRLNAAYGTATILDEKEGIERAFAFTETRPFVPRELVRR